MRSLTRRYLLYLARWQLSTPILALFVYLFTRQLGATLTTVLANLVGGLLFFWVDLWIFRSTDILFAGELWEARNDEVCVDCGKADIRGYRLVKSDRYDRSHDPKPEFRCHECSRLKEQRRKEGVAAG